MRRGSRVLFLAAATLVAAAVAPAFAAPVAKPSVAAMVLTKDDLPGAVVQYQGKKLAPTVAPVVADLPISDKYSRTLAGAKLGSTPIAVIFSSAFVSPSEAQPALLMRELSAAITPGDGRRAFVQAMNSELGKGESLTLTRARPLQLGDAAVELVLHLNLSGDQVDVAEVWIRNGNAITTLAAYTVGRPLTPGQSFALAKVLNGHLKRAVA
jgi:hypothetical protein